MGLYYFDTFDKRVSQVTSVLTGISNSENLYSKSIDGKKEMELSIKQVLASRVSPSIFLCNYVAAEALFEILENDPGLSEYFQNNHKVLFYTCTPNSPMIRNCHGKYNGIGIVDYMDIFPRIDPNIHKLLAIVDSEKKKTLKGEES